MDEWETVEVYNQVDDEDEDFVSNEFMSNEVDIGNSVDYKVTETYKLLYLEDVTPHYRLTVEIK